MVLDVQDQKEEMLRGRRMNLLILIIHELAYSECVHVFSYKANLPASTTENYVDYYNKT